MSEVCSVIIGGVEREKGKEEKERARKKGTLRERANEKESAPARERAKQRAHTCEKARERQNERKCD